MTDFGRHAMNMSKEIGYMVAGEKQRYTESFVFLLFLLVLFFSSGRVGSVTLIKIEGLESRV